MTLIINPAKVVRKPVNIVVRPTPVCVPINNTKQVSATVENSANQGIIWTLVSGGGSINASGIYTAPAASGTAMIRATASVDATVTKDIPVNIKATAGECCSPLIDIYPIAATMYPNQTLQYHLYNDGVEVAASGAQWFSSVGAITSAGLFTAPSSAVNGLETVYVTGAALDATSGTCYDTSTVLVSNNTLGIEVTPKLQSIRVGQSGSLLSDVVGTDNKSVTWSVQQYYEQSTKPITLAPSGIPAVNVTAPSTLPSNPVVRIRATSTVNESLWDEGVIQILDAVLPLQVYPVTKYLANEACNANIADTDLYLESDGYKGNTSALPKYTMGSCDGILKYTWPNGQTSANYIPYTAYDTVTTPPNLSVTTVSLSPIQEETPVQINTTDSMDWNRTFKKPEWEKLYFKINDSGTITSPSAYFVQQDFSSLGSTVSLVTGGVSYLDAFDSAATGFVYSTNSGFFSGVSGEAFSPVASARDIVRFTAYINGVYHEVDIYIRPEPDLPEVFPALCGPYDKEAYSYYPGESPLDFTSYRFTPVAFYDRLANYLTAEQWKLRYSHCSNQCQVVPDWVGKEYNAKIPFALPSTVRYVDDATLTSACKYYRHDSWVSPIFMHYYHGRWACFVPATADADVTVSTEGTMIINDTVPYEIKLTALMNRHYMSNNPDLVSPVKYPANVTYEVVSKTEQINVSPEFASKVTGVYPAYANLSEEDVTILVDSSTNTAKFKITGNVTTGEPKIAYIKVTPNIFGGTYDKSIIVPIMVCPQYVGYKNLGTRGGECNTVVSYKYYGMHFVYHSNVYGSIGDSLISAYSTSRTYVNRGGMGGSTILVRGKPADKFRVAPRPSFVKYASGGEIPVEGMATCSGAKPTNWLLDRGYSSSSLKDYQVALADQGTTCEFSITPYEFMFRTGSGTIKQEEQNQQWFFKGSITSSSLSKISK